jgi:hypothetical protein
MNDFVNRYPTFEDALDDLVEDWLEDEEVDDITAALLAKVEELQAEPLISTEETRIDVQETEE